MARVGLPKGFEHSKSQRELFDLPQSDPELAAEPEEKEPGGIRLTPSRIEWLSEKLRNVKQVEQIFNYVPEVYGIEAELAMLGRATADRFLADAISAGLQPSNTGPFPREMVGYIKSRLAESGFYNGKPYQQEALAISLDNYLRGAYFAQIGTLGHRLVELITQILIHKNDHRNRIDETLQLVIPRLPEEQSIAVGNLIRQHHGKSDPTTKTLLAGDIFAQIVKALEVDDGRLLSGSHVLQMISSRHAQEFLHDAVSSWLPVNQFSKRLIWEIIKSGQPVDTETSCSMNLVIPDEGANTEHKLQAPSRYDLLTDGAIIDYKLTPKPPAERTVSGLLVDLLYLWGGAHLLYQGRVEGGVYYSPAVDRNGYRSLYHTPLHNIHENRVALYHVPLAAKPGNDFIYQHNLTPAEYQLALDQLLLILRLERAYPKQIRELVGRIDSGYNYPYLPSEQTRKGRGRKPTFLDTFDQLPGMRES